LIELMLADFEVRFSANQDAVQLVALISPT
jgi:hypothetical protein